tara:strand:+ start:566 stop:1159 length:594 start_codon:yes stop_codon:yes gene_type:complete
MSEKELKQELQANPAYALQLAVINNHSSIVNAMMAGGLIQDSVSEQDLYELLVEMWNSGERQNVLHILGQVPFQSGILPEGYDELITRGTMQQRYQYGEVTGTGIDLQNPNAMSNSNNQFGNGGSTFANMDWGAIVGGITGMVGDIWGQPDVVVQPGPPQTNYGPQQSGTDTNSIIMYGGIALLVIIILVVVMKVIK